MLSRDGIFRNVVIQKGLIISKHYFEPVEEINFWMDGIEIPVPYFLTVSDTDNTNPVMSLAIILKLEASK